MSSYYIIYILQNIQFKLNQATETAALSGTRAKKPWVAIRLAVMLHGIFYTVQK